MAFGVSASGYGTGGYKAPQASYNGMTYDAARGGYVRTPAVGTSAHAATTKPKFMEAPTGEVYQYNETSGGWDNRGTFGGGGSGGGSGSGGGGGARNPRNDEDINRLIEEIRSSGGDYEPPQIPVVTSGDQTKPFDEKAQAAAYGAAKERTGLAMQAAMRGLKANLMQRGITGSGIDADMQGRIYGGGLSDLANTDRQLAEEAADRAFSAEQSNTDRTIRQNTTNADYLERQRAAKAQEWERKMELISRLTSLKY